ncbi:MAG: hypothetical protein ABIJ18_04830 [archaeon]
MAKNSAFTDIQKGVNSVAPYALATVATAMGLDYAIDGLEQLVQMPEVVEQGLFWGGLATFGNYVLRPVYEEGLVNFGKGIVNLAHKKITKRRANLLPYDTRRKTKSRRNKWKQPIRRHLKSAAMGAGLVGLLANGATDSLASRVEQGVDLFRDTETIQPSPTEPNDYNEMYENIEFKNSDWKSRATYEARLINKNKKAYKKVESRTGVPWYVVGAIHMRESAGDFSTYLHNGEKLGAPTKQVPKGIYFDNWVDAATDAIDKHYKPNQKHGTLEALERFNGNGYRNKSCDGKQVNSPYVWSGSQWYETGKFYGDHKFSCDVVDKQVGTAAILKSMENEGFISGVKLK